jgi:hypothetical protein
MKLTFASAATFAKKSSAILIVLAALGALFTLAFTLWGPLDGGTFNFFDAEYDAQSLAATGFIEWMVLFVGVTFAYVFAGIVTIAALGFAAFVCAAALLFTAGVLVFAAIIVLSPVIAVVGLGWLAVYGLRRHRERNAMSTSVAV